MPYVYYGFCVIVAFIVLFIVDKKKTTAKHSYIQLHEPSHTSSYEPSTIPKQKPSKKYKYQCSYCYYIWTEKRIGLYKCPKCDKWNVTRFLGNYPVVPHPTTRNKNGLSGN